jgi:hypothetical protein
LGFGPTSWKKKTKAQLTQQAYLSRVLCGKKEKKN